MPQLSLLDLPATQGATVGLAGVMPAVRAAMARVAGEYPEGRKVLVDAINEVARLENIALTSGGGKSITKDQLDKWLQSGASSHAPTMDAILCFCQATQNYTPLEHLWKPFRLVLIPAEDMPFLAYGKTCDALKKAKEQKRKLEAKLS
jgi:hypothetical protein